MKRLRTVGTWAAAILLLGSPVHSQTISGSGAVIGRVVDRSQAALPGVRVTVKGPGIDAATHTDVEGHFDIRGPFQAADYQLEFSLPGFSTVRRSITAIAFGVVGMPVTLRVCDASGHWDRVDIGVPAAIAQSSAIVHFRIDAIQATRPAQEAGEGVCGGRETPYAGRTLAVGTLDPGLTAPSGFVVRSGDESYPDNQEFLAFFWWHTAIRQFVPGAYLIPVTNGRLVWPNGDQSILRNGMSVGDALAAVRRIARREATKRER